MRKANFPRLQNLSIGSFTKYKGEQKIKDGSEICMMNLPLIKNILIEFVKLNEHSCYNVRWAMKLQTKQLAKLSNKYSNKAIRDQRRIKEGRFIEALGRKYPGVQTNSPSWVVE